MFSKETIQTLQKFWASISGWKEIEQFGKVFLFILRKPFSHTIQVYKSIEPEDSFKFLVQSFVIFTVITSLFTAFRGNDILKSIILMLNQLFFLTLGTLLYFLIFNKMSDVKRSFTEYLTLYAVYMGFILPFFAIATLLNWQLILMIKDPASGSSGPGPVRAIFTFMAPIIITWFSIYYSARIIRFFWNINVGMVALGMVMVFILTTPLQMLWIRLQCKVGIVPDFEFNSIQHRKLTYELLGCEDVSCKKCLLVGNWKWSARNIQKLEKQLNNSFIDRGKIEQQINFLKSESLSFIDDGKFIHKYTNNDGTIQQYSTNWFLSEDGSQIYFNNTEAEIVLLAHDSLTIIIKRADPNLVELSNDTLYFSASH